MASYSPFTVQLVLSAILLVTCYVTSAPSFRAYRWEVEAGRRLPGHVVATKNTRSLLMCLIKCTRTESCWTVNHRESDGLCELNDADDRWNDITNATKDANFNFYKKIIPRRAEDVSPVFQSSPCASSHILLDGSCFETVRLLIADGLNFTEAKTACDHKFGRLAVLDSPAKESLLNMLPTDTSSLGRYWIDIERNTTGTLVWEATGQAVSLNPSLWRSNQPDNKPGDDCGSIDFELTPSLTYTYGLLDLPCNSTRGYVCQYDQYVHLAW